MQLCRSCARLLRRPVARIYAQDSHRCGRRFFAAERQSSRTYYDILEVSQKAKKEEIKEAYRRLAKKYHPDKNVDDAEAEARFKEIQEAHATLSDSWKKALYDQDLQFSKFGTNVNHQVDREHWTEHWDKESLGDEFQWMCFLFSQTETPEEREARKERYKRYARGERNDMPKDWCFYLSRMSLWPATVVLVVGGTFYVCIKAPLWFDSEHHFCDPMHNDKSVPLVRAFHDPIRNRWERLPEGREPPTPRQLYAYYAKAKPELMEELDVRFLPKVSLTVRAAWRFSTSRKPTRQSRRSRFRWPSVSGTMEATTTHARRASRGREVLEQCLELRESVTDRARAVRWVVRAPRASTKLFRMRLLHEERSTEMKDEEILVLRQELHLLLMGLCPPNVEDDREFLAACKEGRADEVEASLQRLQDPNAEVNERGQAALLVAAKSGHLECVQLLQHSLDPPGSWTHMDATSRRGQGLLHLAAWDGHLEVLRFLLETRAEVNEAEQSGATALHVAAQRGHGEVVRLLLEAGVSRDQATTDHGKTALHLAAQCGHLDVELLEHREALLQCLELRDGMQILGEVVDRTSELDLSLAGVSDNTARHGRAIASLTEQQQRTTQTMDAVIRAARRLDRSRSRQARPTSTTPSELASGRSRTSRGEGEEEKSSSSRSDGSKEDEIVCLATDLEDSEHSAVAVKIIRDVRRYLENAKVEAKILECIRREDRRGKHHCCLMYDTFIHESKFFCLVFEPLGSSLYDFIKKNHFRGLWLADLQKVAKQTLKALQFLHERLQLTHTDLKAENILFEFWEAQGHSTRDHYWRPDRADIKLIDFGNATFKNEHHASIINTRQPLGAAERRSSVLSSLSRSSRGKVTALATASSAAAPCRLAFLQLRSRDLAVDLTPSFDPEVFNYAATLEFAMEEFSIDAKVPEGCELSGLPNRPFLAPAPNREGEENAKETNLCVRDPPSGKEQWYRISVTKLAGSETEVLGLQLRGGELHPSFEPAVRSYTAHMDVAYEFIQVSYVVLDNGQRLRWKATPEVPEATVGGHDRDGPNEDDGGNTTEERPSPKQLCCLNELVRSPKERRLTGEKQHFLRHEVFPIDVGYTRKVTLSIQSADPMQDGSPVQSRRAARGVYFLEVTRGHCPPRQPFFEPRTRACTLECPQGTYPNHAQGRCSYCNRNCAVCQTLAICELCLQECSRYHPA
eukprot:g24698.t2